MKCTPAGRTPTTATPAGAAARAGDEAAATVTATGAWAAGPGKRRHTLLGAGTLLLSLFLRRALLVSPAGRTPAAAPPDAGATVAAVATVERSNALKGNKNHV